MHLSRRGRPPKLGERQIYPLRMPTDLHRELRHQAVDEGRSMNDVLLEYIQESWDERRTGRQHQRERVRDRRDSKAKTTRLRLGPN
jgi:hypothetical protein